MQALYAVAYRNGKPRDVWLELLRQFRELLGISKADYQFQAGVPGIAEKVNQVTDRRARLYFLRIIHDVHLAEVEGMFWLEDKTRSLATWFEDKTESPATFEQFYSELAKNVRLD